MFAFTSPSPTSPASALLVKVYPSAGFIPKYLHPLNLIYDYGFKVGKRLIRTAHTSASLRTGTSLVSSSPALCPGF